MFPRGHLLWQGLTSIHDYVEHRQTGGGLSRPMFAEFLKEASQLGYTSCIPVRWRRRRRCRACFEISELVCFHLLLHG